MVHLLKKTSICVIISVHFSYKGGHIAWAFINSKKLLNIENLITEDIAV